MVSHRPSTGKIVVGAAIVLAIAGLISVRLAGPERSDAPDQPPGQAVGRNDPRQGIPENDHGASGPRRQTGRNPNGKAGAGGSINPGEWMETPERMVCNVTRLPRTMPRWVVNLPRRGIRFVDDDFGESRSARVQELLGGFNASQMALSELSYAGTCNWYDAKGLNDTSEHSLHFRRGAPFEQVCYGDRRYINEGVAVVSPTVDPDYVDSYYLVPLAVHDPREFDRVRDGSLKQRDAGTGDETAFQVEVVESRRRLLYFDKDDGRLRRIAFRTSPEDEPHVYVDVLKYAERVGRPVPSVVQATFADPSKFRAAAMPEAIVLRVDPETIRLAEED